MMNKSCPNPQALAAFAEGRLSETERLAVVEHLSSCEGCYEVVAETLHLMEELADEGEESLGAHSEAHPGAPSGTQGFWSPGKSGRRFLPWAASLTVTALALWFVLPFLQPPSVAGRIQLDRLPAGWANPQWASRTRGPDPGEAPILLRVGAMHLDLEVALEGEKTQEAMQAVTGLLNEIGPGGGLPVGRYESLKQSLSKGSISDARDHLRHAEAQLKKNLEAESKALYLLGQWLEVVRLVALSETWGVFLGRDYQRRTANLNTSPDLGDPYRQDFQDLAAKVEGLPLDPGPEQQQALLDQVNRLVPRAPKA